MDSQENPLDKLVQAVAASPKYRGVCRSVIAHIGSQELAKGRNLKEAIKATKNKLHQVGGAYLTRKTDYVKCLDQLTKAAQASRSEFLQVCRRVMSYHASTKERLPILDQFYSRTLGPLGPLHCILDVACGLNPLSIPWMPLAEKAQYYAYDIYEDMAAFLNTFFSLVGVQGQAIAQDVTCLSSAPKANVALLLKAIPCLEQIDSSVGLQLLDSLRADYLLISFPIRSLGGREKGMVTNYEDRFRELIAGRDWTVQRFEFATELAFLVAR